MEIYELKGLIKQPTCYQNPVKLLCIVDLTLTNVPRMFQSTYMIEIGLFRFSFNNGDCMRNIFKKVRNRIINYRSFKDFSNKMKPLEFL